MNPLAKHPVLQFLPYEIKKQPSFETIKRWLEKKVKTFKIFRILTVIAFLIYSTIFFISRDTKTGIEGLDILGNIFDYVLPISLLVLSIFFHYLIKKYDLSNEEINTELQKYSNYIKNVNS